MQGLNTYKQQFYTLFSAEKWNFNFFIVRLFSKLKNLISNE